MLTDSMQYLDTYIHKNLYSAKIVGRISEAQNEIMSYTTFVHNSKNANNSVITI